MKLFFSYSRAQEAELANIVHASKVYHECWYDQNIGAGDEWWTEILSQIRNCEIFVFLLSKESTKSKACQAELTYANKLGRHIIALQIDDLDVTFMPHLLKNNNTTSYKPENEGREVRLATILKNISDNIGNYINNWADPGLVPEPAIPITELSEIYSTLKQDEPLNAQHQRELLFRLEKLIDKKLDDPQRIEYTINAFLERDDTTVYIGKKLSELIPKVPEPILNNYVLEAIISQVTQFTDDKDIGKRLSTKAHNPTFLYGQWRLLKTIQNNQLIPLMMEENIVFKNDFSFFLIQNYMQTNFGTFSFQNEFLTIYFMNGVRDTRCFQCFENELFVVQFMNTVAFNIAIYKRLQ
jgi:hypothetical protein